jgi:hypothetical protein
MIAVDFANGKIKQAQAQLARMTEMRDKPRSVPIIDELKTFIESEIEKHSKDLENAKTELASNIGLLKNHLTKFPALMDEVPALRAEYFPETVVTPPPKPEITFRPRELQQGLLFPEDAPETPVTNAPFIPQKAASRAAPTKKEPAQKATKPMGAGSFLLNSDPDLAAERRENRRRQRSGED